MQSDFLSLFFIYAFIYTILLPTLIWILSPSTSPSVSLALLLFSFLGLPPFCLFFLKWTIFACFIYNSILISIWCICRSILSVIIYLKLVNVLSFNFNSYIVQRFNSITFYCPLLCHIFMLILLLLFFPISAGRRKSSYSSIPSTL